ncbi:hypothetical protein [Pedobacter sp. FW305-3-2-15-E-R2A2]|uniref:hypothetical protein n=1 Tax=Pedobacter sp. FW305-3-2-15-E-R2A2 TaxID=3140251 RepID=UPI0031403914
MKNKLTTALLMLIVLTGFYSCQPKVETKTEEKHQEKKFLNAKAIDNEPVNFILADSCVELYEKTDPRLLPRTNSIVFKRGELIKWINQLEKTVDYDNMRICLGIYTDTILRKYKKPDSLRNRVSLFLYPFKGKNRAKTLISSTNRDQRTTDPFNMGELHP